MGQHDGFERNVPRYYLFSGLMSSALWFPIWIIFLQERGLSLSQIGLLEMLAWIVMAAMEVPTGIVADTYGRRVSLMLGALLSGLSMFAILTGVLSPIFMVGYVLWNSSHTFISGAGEALLYDSLKASRRVATYIESAGRNQAVVQVAGGSAGLLGGLIAVWDMRACFVITGVLAFIAAGVALSLREPPHLDEGERQPTFRDNLRAGVRIAAGLPRVRYIVMLGATTTLFATLLTGFLFQPYADEVRLPVWLLGAVLLLANGGATLGAWLAGRAERRLGRTPLLVGALLAAVVLQLLLWLAAAPLAVILFAAIALALALVQPVLSALLNDAIPSAQRATIISLQALLSSAALGVLQLGLFTLAAWTSTALAIGVAGLLMACLVVPVLVLLQRAAARQEPESVVPVAGCLTPS